ncbi:MAG TPA: 4a-hydroxytetrahydrobiopterin dehydratase [Gammaproteobacteria bacterium]|nr:4a-hydroxytetrahydrobiopterin dehydratase [Gammaproteobacteria bacterium]
MDAVDLTQKHCQACEGGTPPLTTEEADSLLGQVHEEWSLNEQGKEISRAFRFKNYYHTMAFVNAVAWVAHQEDHHPDLEVGYNRCRVRYSTHAIGGLSENDFICAAKIDRLLQA